MFYGAMQSHRETEKARRYLDLLDAARCDGSWEQVPELVRKVGKHAPHRKCLILVAQSERQIATQDSTRPSAPTIASPSLAKLVPELIYAVENEGTFPEDVFQAQVCLGWLHWIIEEPRLALARLPANISVSFDHLKTNTAKVTGSTQVCFAKGAYVQGACLESEGSLSEVARTYESVLPVITNITSSSTGSSEYRLWAERLLTRYCMLTSRQYLPSTEKANGSLPSTISLAPFRAWASFWGGRPGQGLTVFDRAESDRIIRRRHVWQAYYETISKILRNGSPYPSVHATGLLSSGSASTSQEKKTGNARLQQSAELRRVEATYEGLLLKEVQFPEANKANTEVEKWVNQVMVNWGILCGPTWTDEDLGQGGREAVGRNVLDVNAMVQNTKSQIQILYRAATKTFHSTPILRHLFTVHSSLTEFDLAGKALDSYLEIISKGMARVDKSGETALGLDNDETAIQIVASGIDMLCTFGRRKEAEKAQDLAAVLKRWLDKHRGLSPATPSMDGNMPQNGPEREKIMGSHVSGIALAAGHRAIGVSQAHWAKLTFETSTRADLQARAISSFRDALNPSLNDVENVETLYALALVLAETRDLDGAIVTAKKALSIEPRTAITNSALSFSSTGYESSIEKDRTERVTYQRRIIKIWHLLALLLSARQDFETAEASCQAALDGLDVQAHTRDESHFRSQERTLSSYVKQNYIEIKITQLALAEVSEGPEIAVNGGGELLELYANLLRPSTQTVRDSIEPNSEPSPLANSEPIKSLRGSFFSRSRNADTGTRTNIASNSIRSQRTSNDMSRAPEISITNEDGQVPHLTNNHLFHHNSKRLQKRNSKRSIGSIRRALATNSARAARPQDRSHSNTLSTENGTSMADGSRDISSNSLEPYSSNEVGVAVSHNIVPEPESPTTGQDNSPTATQAMPAITHNYNQKKQPQPLGHSKQPPDRDVRLPTMSPNSSAPQPEPRFVEVEQQRRSLSLLLKIWLLIAGLYRRARMYDDAKGALDEAFQHVRSVEAAVASKQSSSQAFSEAGSGGVKSVEELWADVYAEKGDLLQAQCAPHHAMTQYESALSHFPDHPAATVGLCTLLLDIYSEVIQSQPTSSSSHDRLSSSDSSSNFHSSHPVLAPISSRDELTRLSSPTRIPVALGLPLTTDSGHSPPPTIPRPSLSQSKTPEALNRLAARDRAYGLLSSLTKLGTGWDNSEAWFALARAYEEGGELERAREILWWVVELEEKRPIRGWDCLGQGYSL